jgi:preprotein translocase subunit SecD
VNRATRWRVGGVGALVLLFGFLALANFVPVETRERSTLLPDKGIRLGLDLQGGIHWVVAPDLRVAENRELDYLREALRRRMEEEDLVPVRLAVDEDRILVELDSDREVELVRRFVEDTGVLRELDGEGTALELGLSSEWVREVRERGMLQVLEVLRRRIDDPIQGVQDSVVTRQGNDRVLVQIPGGQLDREQARGLLRKTGFLEFKLVLDVAESDELLRARHSEGFPDETEVAFERDSETDRVVYAYLMRKTADLTGEFLNDARSSLDNRFGWIVNFAFNAEGARRFRDLTAANKGKQLAILLDGRVRSAPTIQERIGARGIIRGRFSSQEAAELAVILRAGSLPIPVKIEEERTVGPALGADSIRRGFRASILGLAFVVGFGVWYYRFSGIYASLALLSNLLLVLGIMSLARATLTLPGIAGLVLTVGMAIDANVIIFERIREELRQGKMPRAAVRTGFNKALWTVLDANITTLITAIVLFQFGTGPIKGFAVTLSIGIVTSVFAAMVITRLFYEIHPGNRPVQALSI